MNSARGESHCGGVVSLHPLCTPVVCHYCWKYDYYSAIAWHLLRIQGLCLHGREKYNYLGTWRKERFLAWVIQMDTPKDPRTTPTACCRARAVLSLGARCMLTFYGHTCRHYTWFIHKQGKHLIFSSAASSISLKWGLHSGLVFKGRNVSLLSRRHNRMTL